MKIQKSEIAPKLAALKSIALGKGCAGAVQGVLFQGNKLTAYDLSIGLTATLSTDTDEEFIIPPKAIEMIEKFPSGEIEIVGNDKDISLKCNGTKSRYVTTAVRDYPETFSLPPQTQTATIDGTLLRDYAESVLYAVPDNCMREIQTGVLLDADGEKLHMVACDGARIAHSWMEYGGKINLVIPKASFQKLLSVGMTGPVTISYTSNKAVFSSEEYALFTRLLEGDFIDYKTVQPTNDNVAEIDRKALIESLARAVLCIDGSNMVPIVMDFNGNSLSMRANSPIMAYSDELNLESPVKAPVTLGINAKFLQDALKSLDGDVVKIAIGGATKPLFITEGDTLAMVMPVHLKGEAQ